MYKGDSITFIRLFDWVGIINAIECICTSKDCETSKFRNTGYKISNESCYQ